MRDTARTKEDVGERADCGSRAKVECKKLISVDDDLFGR